MKRDEIHLSIFYCQPTAHIKNTQPRLERGLGGSALLLQTEALNLVLGPCMVTHNAL